MYHSGHMLVNFHKTYERTLVGYTAAVYKTTRFANYFIKIYAKYGPNFQMPIFEFESPFSTI